ncbi:GNAT family N-acetyltransferase [Flavobacterium geliluteum]|uniref:GNAT family N-acetyltransferase n=1 Tax=Flavobacterium geliluteum TaxID=2816120 RepID=A0A941AXX5_9FLAO|nr:GNAT family N-acetyltransferase [Flavobacterium geliluteum]MBP4138626.1 GNAT family N-acetyltransferase [Flavobacterium geliluteum]
MQEITEKIHHGGLLNEMEKIKLTFKKATELDINYLLCLREETMTEHLINAGMEVSKESNINRIMHLFNQAKIIFYNDEKVGFLKVIENTEKIEIIQIQIDPKHQRKGIGQKILSSIFEKAFCKNLKVTLSVLKGNRAIQLYLKNGFKITAENTNSFIMTAQKPQ